MQFEIETNPNGVNISVAKAGFLGRLLSEKPDLTSANPGSASTLHAIAELRFFEEDQPGSVSIQQENIFINHEVLSRLSPTAAEALSLPKYPDLTFSTEVSGTVGTKDFGLRYKWLRDGQPEMVRRIGAILQTSDGPKRLPQNIFAAAELSDAPSAVDLTAQWNQLARFRSSLLGAEADAVGPVAMTDFLSGLQVHIASGFSIEPKAGDDNYLDYTVNAHKTRDLDADTLDVSSEAFSSQVRDRGSIPAYRLATGSYVIVDQEAKPVLDVLAEMQNAEPQVRDSFVRNPLPFISNAIEKARINDPQFSGLDDIDRQAALEDATTAFVETEGYSERVLGVGVYEKLDIDFGSSSGAVWFPETWNAVVSKIVSESSPEELLDIAKKIDEAQEAGETSVFVKGEELPADNETKDWLRDFAQRKRDGRDGSAEVQKSAEVQQTTEPVILQPKENTTDLRYRAPITPRVAKSQHSMPKQLKTTMRGYQQEGFEWSKQAWIEGIPGVLNADEQGLGKTLQALSFLAWMQEQTGASSGSAGGPILVVAPVSLLRNWEAEVEQHFERPGLGVPIRLYGDGLAAFKRPSMAGKDIDDAQDHLDLSLIMQAVEENRAHRMWVITTYNTLTNYQHSLGKIPFSAIVFDEIQALKNPGTLAAKAAKSMKADFRIGLTGTPVENTIDDMWAITDQLWPGYLKSLQSFRDTFDSAGPSPEQLRQLHDLIFTDQEGHSKIGIRRLKQYAAPDLPEKQRLLHPGLMPLSQATAYDDARLAFAKSKGFGAMLKVLHRIRGVSLHPDPTMIEGFDEASARLRAALEVLDGVKEANERALIFIEDRRFQQRFIALARARYDLDFIDLINGSTKASKRKDIVDRFQSNKSEGNFALLVLGPKAAGTGLTLTAATHVIHLSRWWNPAVEEQCNDRIHRIGQDQAVKIHIPMAIHSKHGIGSFDCQLQLLMERKRQLAIKTLFPVGDAANAELGELGKTIGIENSVSEDTTVQVAMAELFHMMGEKGKPKSLENGVYELF